MEQVGYLLVKITLIILLHLNVILFVIQVVLVIVAGIIGIESIV